jgi:hypothetical protein
MSVTLASLGTFSWRCMDLRLVATNHVAGILSLGVDPTAGSAARSTAIPRLSAEVLENLLRVLLGLRRGFFPQNRSSQTSTQKT